MKTKILDTLCKTFSLRDTDTMGQPCVCVKKLLFSHRCTCTSNLVSEATLFFLNQNYFFS